MNILNTQQKKIINELLNQKDIVGKKTLKHFLWVNSTDPKYKIGDCFYISVPGSYIFDKPVINFKAKIVAISTFFDVECFNYEFEIIILKDVKKYTFVEFLTENDICSRSKCSDNINDFFSL